MIDSVQYILTCKKFSAIMILYYMEFFTRLGSLIGLFKYILEPGDYNPWDNDLSAILIISKMLIF